MAHTSLQRSSPRKLESLVNDLYYLLSFVFLTVYIVEIKTGQRTRNGYRPKHPLRGDTKIKLFGEDGETLEHKLRSSDKTSR